MTAIITEIRAVIKRNDWMWAGASRHLYANFSRPLAWQSCRLSRCTVYNATVFTR